MKSQLVHSCMINNFQNSVQKYKQNVLFLGIKSLQKGRIYSWKEYLEHMQFKENNNWLSILKLALEIYNGDLKGYALVADEKEVREQNLKNYMEDLVKSTIETVILKFKKRESAKTEKENFSTNSGSGSSKEGDFQTDSIAIKVAIEFCLNIGSINYLFTEMLLLFEQNNLRQKFIQNLEPFIISGQFRKEMIPKVIIEQILNQYESSGDSISQLKNLERIVQQLDLKKYDDLMRARLEIICEKNCMVSALLALQSSQDKKGSESSILMTMFNLMKKVGQKEQNKKSQTYTYKDIKDLLIVDSKVKYQIEKSKCYIGYKLLWIIKMYLEGRSFPYGSLQHEKFEQYSIQISKLMMNNQFIKEFLEFDSKCFFDSIQKLFFGQPFNFIAYLKPEPLTMIINLNNLVQEQNSKHSKSQSQQDPDETVLMRNFYNFLLIVQVQHQRWQIAQTMKGKHVKGQKVLKLDFNLIMSSIYSTLKSWAEQLKLTENTSQLDQTLIIDAIQAQPQFGHSENQQLLKLIDELNISEHMINLRIFLLEHSNNYLQSFKLQMLDTKLRQNVFQWIERRFQELEGGVDQGKFVELKNTVAGQMREIIQIDVDQTLKLIEKWYEDTFVDQVILQELDEYPEVQLDFLRKFIHFNEEIIRLVIKDNAVDIGKKPQHDKFMRYLCLFIELMCKLSSQQRGNVTPQVIEAYVKIEYYPIAQCLDICQKYNEKRAIAALLERSNDFIGAIDTYMQHIKSMSLVLIGTELCQIVRDCQQREQKRKKVSVEETQQSSEELILQYGHYWDYEECYKYRNLTDFDQSLQKACDLAKRVYDQTPHIPKSSRARPNDDEDGEKAWFRVLVVLDEWQKTISTSLMNEAYKNQDNLEKLQKTNVGRHLPTVGGLLSDFLTRRINSIIMRQLPIQIDPETLIDRLTLSLNSIRQIFEFKVKVIKNEKKIIKTASKFMTDEVLRKENENRQEAAIGYLMESDPQAQKQKNQKQISRDICDFCKYDLVSAYQKCPVRVYMGCGHTFHSHCVTQFIKEQNEHAKKNKAESPYSKFQCIECVRLEGHINLQDIRDACKYQQGISQRMSMRRSTLDEPSSPEHTRESNLEIESAQSLKEEADTMMMHKMEDFENLISQSQIYLSDFSKL